MSTTVSAESYVPATASAELIRHSRVSWGGILAGALVAVAVGATLNILGVAIGATAVDAVARDTPSATTMGISAGIWLLVANLIGLAAGGYIAARLSGNADRTDAALHGLGVWAAAFIVSAVMLGSAVSGGLSAGMSAVSGIASGAGATVAAAADQVDPQAVAERVRLSLSGPSEPSRMTTEQRAAELTGLIGKRVANGSFTAEERTRINALVAAEAGIPEAEAAQRVAAYEAEAQATARQAEETARRAADAAAEGAATAAFWMFAVLLLGALAAILGARSGVVTRGVVAGRRMG